MLPKKIALGLFLCLFSAASVAELIEFKQAGEAQVNGFVGIGCGAGVMTGVHLTSDVPKALCAVLSIDPSSIVKVTSLKGSKYACPIRSAILLASPEDSFIICGEPKGSSVHPHRKPAEFVNYRKDIPACPLGQVVTAISFTRGQAVCNTLIE